MRGGEGVRSGGGRRQVDEPFSLLEYFNHRAQYPPLELHPQEAYYPCCPIISQPAKRKHLINGNALFFLLFTVCRVYF